VAGLLIYRGQACGESLAFDWNPFELRLTRPSSRQIQQQAKFPAPTPLSPPLLPTLLLPVISFFPLTSANNGKIFVKKCAGASVTVGKPSVGKSWYQNVSFRIAGFLDTVHRPEF
jgi:hypothetical protein